MNTFLLFNADVRLQTGWFLFNFYSNFDHNFQFILNKDTKKFDVVGAQKASDISPRNIYTSNSLKSIS